MKQPKIFWIIGVLLFAVGSIAIQYQVKYAMHQTGTGSMQEMGNLKVGQPAPDFTVPDLSGQPVTLQSYKGKKVVMMDFWATWCGPCRMSMPGLQELADKFKGQDLEILSVNQGETADQVSQFINRQKYTFHVVLDQDQAIANKYSVQAIPTLVIIDKNGVVQWLSVGYSKNEDDLRELVEKLIKK